MAGSGMTIRFIIIFIMANFKNKKDIVQATMVGSVKNMVKNFYT